MLIGNGLGCWKTIDTRRRSSLTSSSWMSCAVERDPPAAGGARGDLGEPVERAQQRRLARARRADQRQHLALAHRQADVAHDPVLAVGQPHRLDAHPLAHVRPRARPARERERGGAAARRRRRWAARGRRRRAARGRPRSAARAAASAGPCASLPTRRASRRCAARSARRSPVRRVTSALSASTIISSTNAAA